jgi:hypothetical protein
MACMAAGALVIGFHLEEGEAAAAAGLAIARSLSR